MAHCIDEYAGARDHVTEVNAAMFEELDARACPRCDCRQTRPVDDDDDGQELACLPLRVCAQMR